MKWSVYFLSFEKVEIVPDIQYAYMVINYNNMIFSSLSVTYEHTVSSFYRYHPFDWFEIPYERYHNEFLQYDSGQYSPFSF